MSIHKQIKDDTIAALKARDQQKRQALSFLASELNKVAKDNKIEGELPDDRSIQILQKQLKQRRETLDASLKVNRQDLADDANYEIGVIQAYLPQGLSLQEMTTLAQKVITELGATSPKQMGQVMAAIAKEAPQANKAEVSSIVKAMLSK